MDTTNDTALPQNVSGEKREIRKQALKANQDLYQLTTKLSPTVSAPMVGATQAPPRDLKQFRGKLKFEVKKVALGSATLLQKLIKGTGKFQNMQELYGLYRGFLNPFPTPKCLENWKSDESFVRQRLQGLNSCVIRLCTELPQKFGITQDNREQIKNIIGIPIEEAVAQKMVFVVDYQMFHNVTREDVTIPAPIALFFQRQDGVLIPIAIQLHQDPSPTNPVFLPTDPESTWIVAKMWFNVADAAYHQAVPHLGFTHLVMGGIGVVTLRHIHSNHPIYKLLYPHFENTLHVNAQITRILVNSGVLDGLFCVGTVGILKAIQKTQKTWRLDVEGCFPADLKNRGVADPALLPHYHYRNDGLKLYDVILKYVTSYVYLYYTNDDDVISDVELQEWRREITSPFDGDDVKGLGILGVPGEGNQFSNREQVCTTLTSIIFTCSASHASVSNEMYDEYAFPPNYSGRLYGPLPTSKVEISEEMFLQILPDKDQTINAMVSTVILGPLSEIKLGEVDIITDPKAFEVLEAFRKDLKHLSQDIELQNKERKVPYNRLNPKFVGASIHI